MMKILICLALGCISLAQGDTSGYASSHDKVMGCYWGAWSFYRTGYGKFGVEQIDPRLCTHGFYGFADLDEISGIVKPVDPWYDLGPNDSFAGIICNNGYACHYDGYRNFIKLKEINPNFVPLISVGGWNAGSEKFSHMAGDAGLRLKFIQSIIDLVETFGFEGVDLDWEYPGSRHIDGSDKDKEHFTILVKEMSQVIHDRGQIFTAAMSPGWQTIDSAYDIPEVLKEFDFINVMTYDYHGAFKNHNFTGHNSPIFRRPDEINPEHPGYLFNVFDTINYYISLGASPDKIVMGIPLYGRGFQLTNWKGDNAETGLYCPTGPGVPMGPYSLQNGIWIYLEILQALFNNTLNSNLPDAQVHGWKEVRDDCIRAPYVVNGPYWMGYDDPLSATVKSYFLNFMGLRGGFIWSIDNDDFDGRYSNETFPMTKAINRGIASGIKFNPEDEECIGTAPACLWSNLTTTTTSTSTTTTPNPLVCTKAGEIHPYPGNCHKYYICLQAEIGSSELVTMAFDCGDAIFDPYQESCVDSSLPASTRLCDE